MRRLGRRHFLRGVGGAVLALPLFESLVGSKAFAQTTRHRFTIFVRSGNGVVQASSESAERFWPDGAGALTVAGLRDTFADRATSELSAHATRLLMVKNVRLPFARSSCGHAEAIPQVLTAQNHTGGSGNDPKALGRSVDWYLAEKLNPQGVGPLTFMAGPQSTYIAEALSWSAAQTRTPAERSPLNAYMRLVGLSSSPPEVQQLIASRRKSVNDLVRAQLRALVQRPELSAWDRQRLEQHLQAVRDMELRMTCDLEPAQVSAVQAVTSPESNDVRPEVVRRFMDLAAWAFNCRLNHVATLQIGEGNDQTQYTINGSKLPRFHWISHRIYADGSEGEPIPDALELHHQVDRLQMQLFKYLLDRLDSYQSPYGGTLLDDSLAVWMNDLGLGPPHSADNTPWILAGRAGGGVTSGRIIDHQKKGVNLVLNTVINAMGIRNPDGSQVQDFGDPSLTPGVITGVLA
ncbi:MAG: DUF1552 domain-containing protein [Myxococcota bacterium]